MKNFDELFSWFGSGVCMAFTAVQTEQLLQLISLAATILTTCVTLAYTIWKWYKKATQDGEITTDEIDELFEASEKIVNKFKKENDNEQTR